jgi:HAE1 family hydrophobic/amphiphilic exporter-1
MSAVFLPTAFLDGPVGVFYRQFSLTLAISILISGINALTLTPALCALLLKPHDTHAHKKTTWLQRFFNGFNNGYNNVEKTYSRLVFKTAGRRILSLVVLAIFCVAIWATNKVLPSGFIPTEDQSMVYVNVTTPAGSTVERTQEVLATLTKKAKSLKQIDNVTTLAGYSLITEVAGASYGMAMINLKPWNERKEDADEIIKLLENTMINEKDAIIEFFPPPTVPGFGNASGFEMRLLDKSRSGDLTKIAAVSNNFIKALKESPEIETAFTSFDPSFPQYLIHVDYDLAAQKGVTVQVAMDNLQTLMGSFYATNFIRFGQMYKVMVQASPEFRSKPEDILKLFVKNDKGEMVAYNNFIRIERVFGPEQLTRYNMYTSAMINGIPAKGYSSGDAIAAIKRIAKEKLPKGFDYEWSGMTREQIISGNQAGYIFLICLVFVYLILAAQYESFKMPFAVILSLPAGIFGSFLFLKMLGLENNIYAQVSLVMLIGLLGKNAILIVEIAMQRRQQGVSILAAAKEGAVSRLRPILMTSFAFVAGLIPLVIATGAGALGNRSIGTASLGGMLTGTLFGVFIIPGLYVIFAKLSEKNVRKKRAIKKEPALLAEQ